ncbi:MAG: winged helix-turn-helix domain-containing protein [Candidatus Methanoperedens sp.]|nr:winged helix-turn-helix domain-containing protein [Candidatus Methanoperedens sp.]
MNINLSALELRTISLLDAPLSISELTEKTGVTKGYISRTVASLKDKGFVETSKIGITKKVALSSNLHAARFRYLLHNRSYMPLDELLQGSGMQILGVLASGSADFTRLREESGVSKATLWRRIRKFKDHAMLLSRNNEYELPQDLKDIREFLEHFCSYFAVSTMKEISPAGNFIAAKGFEFLFSLKEELIHENARSTGLTSISDEIPLMLAENYYFYTSRTLSREEIAVHAIVADPHSKRNLTYVIIYVLKVKLDMALFLKIAKRYRVEDIAGNVLKLLNTWEKPEEPYMPDPAYVREKLKEYKIQW